MFSRFNLNRLPGISTFLDRRRKIKQQEAIFSSQLTDSLSADPTIASLAKKDILETVAAHLPAWRAYIRKNKAPPELLVQAVSLLIPHFHNILEFRDALVSFVTTKNPDVRHASQSLLVNLGGPSAAEVFAAALLFGRENKSKHVNNIVEETQSCLIKLGTRATLVLAAGLKGQRAGLNTERFRLRALQTLARMGEVASGAIDAVTPMLWRGTKEVCIHAIKVLANTGEQGRSQLITAIRQPQRRSLSRKELVTKNGMLELVNGPDAIPVLISLLNHKKNLIMNNHVHRIQRLAADTLGTLGTSADAAIPHLVAKMGSSSAVAEACTLALLRIGSAAAFKVFEKLVDRNEKVSIRVIETLAKYARTDPAIQAMLLKELPNASESVQLKLLDVFYRLGNVLAPHRGIFERLAKGSGNVQIIDRANAILTAFEH